MLKRLATVHDALTWTGFRLAMFCIVAIVSSYTYETVARYFFASPTWWSNEVVGYALCIGVFLAMPELTRRNGHIAITFLLEQLPQLSQRRAAMSLNVVSGLVCILVAYVSLQENIRQIENDVMVVRVEPIPKIWISAWITYGFLSTGIHFLRGLGGAQDDSGGAKKDIWS